MAGEVYLHLCTHLIQVFDSGPKPLAHLNVGDEQTDVMLRKFRLLNQFQLELPACWARFSEHIYRDVMDCTFSLLKSDGRKGISALQFLAAIDPKALWFEKWILSNVGRLHVVESLAKVGLLAEIVTHLLNNSIVQTIFSNEGLDLQNNDVIVLDFEEAGENVKVISASELEYLQFLHSVLILSKLSQFTGGRGLFPISVEKSHLNSEYNGFYNQLVNAQVICDEASGIFLLIEPIHYQSRDSLGLLLSFFALYR